MSKTNSQSTQAEECGVSKISAEVEALLDSLPLRTRAAIASEFDELVEKHYEEKSLWAAQQHEDAAKITVLETKLNTIKDDVSELNSLFNSITDTYKIQTYRHFLEDPPTHAEYLIKKIFRETSLKRRR
tara:strand:+ start:1411 stop:1797 length:387 start_codon:yes stop_codon:yes gene_type:complete